MQLFIQKLGRPSLPAWSSAFLLMTLSAHAQAIEPKIDAIKPGCTTFTISGKATSSCWIGINPWEKTTAGVETISSSITTSDITEIWTATNTNFLAEETTVITTNSSTISTATTEYISFVTQSATATATSGGDEPIIIEGVVIVPALAVALQPIASNAAGRSASDITSDINTQLQKLKVTLSAADVAKLAFYLKTSAEVAAVIGVPFIIGPYVNNAIATYTGGAAVTVTSSTADSTVTAIWVTPIPNWKDLKSAPVPSGSLPDGPETVCGKNSTGASISIQQAQTWIGAFCGGNNTKIGNASYAHFTDSNNNAMVITYLPLNGTCLSNCTESYNDMFSNSTCSDGKTLSGFGKVTAECGSYEYAVEKAANSTSSTSGSSRTATSPTASASASSTVKLTCQSNSPNTFSVDNAKNAMSKFCVQNRPITQTGQTYDYSGGNIYMAVEISQDSTGCADNTWGLSIDPDDCNNYFGQAVNDCDPNTTTAKLGANPLRWSSSKGCLDFIITGTAGS